MKSSALTASLPRPDVVIGTDDVPWQWQSDPSRLRLDGPDTHDSRHSSKLAVVEVIETNFAIYEGFEPPLRLRMVF